MDDITFWDQLSLLTKDTRQFGIEKVWKKMVKEKSSYYALQASLMASNFAVHKANSEAQKESATAASMLALAAFCRLDSDSPLAVQLVMDGFKVRTEMVQ